MTTPTIHSTLRRLTALAALLAALPLTPLGAAPAKAVSVDAHYTSASLSTQEQEAGNLLNSDRQRYNLPALVIDPALCRIARIKSQDMMRGGYFSHVSPTYGSVRDMLTQFGYAYSAASENIARHSSVAKAQAAFLSSPSHRRNVLSSAFTKVGIGVAVNSQGHVYLTQIFVR